MKTSDYMAKAYSTDDEEVTYYDGPYEWTEGIDDSLEVDAQACAIIGDDMWLTFEEVVNMMSRIRDLPETKERGVRWQEMRITWRSDIEHYVMEVPFYGN